MTTFVLLKYSRHTLSNLEVVLIIRLNCSYATLSPQSQMQDNTTTQGTEKNLELMRNFAQSYAKRTGTYFCSDLGVTAVVLEGLAKHKDDLGAPLCPCRHYEDKEAEAKATYWNCPCVPMQERHECHCMLFLTDRKSTRLNSSHVRTSRMPSSA